MKKVPATKRYYEPIQGETHKAWLAFCAYRDMGPNRSLDKAHHAITRREGRHQRHWATWSKKNHWVTRAAAYDTAVGKRQRKIVEEDRIAKYRAAFGEFQ